MGDLVQFLRAAAAKKNKKLSDIETERCLNLRGEEREREHHRTHVQFTHPSVDNISIHIYILCNI